MPDGLFSYYASPIGRIGLAASAVGLTRLWFCETGDEQDEHGLQSDEICRRVAPDWPTAPSLGGTSPSPAGAVTTATRATWRKACLPCELIARASASSCGVLSSNAQAALDATTRWLDRYFTGRDPGFLPPLDLETQGTPFRRTAWRLLLDIPFGQTTTYGRLARELARLTGRERMSAQAVGQAVGSNPIAIIVPCHRVLGSQGQLTGYAYGLLIKKALLQLEGVQGPIAGSTGSSR